MEEKPKKTFITTISEAGFTAPVWSIIGTMISSVAFVYVNIRSDMRTQSDRADRLYDALREQSENQSQRSDRLYDAIREETSRLYGVVIDMLKDRNNQDKK